jgi:transposase-like protein
MESNFKNLQQLLDFFKDETTCKSYYEQKRWGGNVACTHCGSLKNYRTNRGYKCGEKLCHKKFSVISETIFENTKVGLRTWFAAMYLISTPKKGISSLQLAEQLGITQKTAWFINHRIREMLKDDVSEKLTDTVEVDETFVGGKNKNRHKDKKVEKSQGRSFKDKTPVVGLLARAEYEIIEREHKVIKGKIVKEKVITKQSKVVLQVVTDTQQKSVEPVVNNNVEDGTIVYSDEWHAYNNLSNNYEHSIVNHSVKEYVNGMVHTNGIEGFWSILKRGYIGIYHTMSKQHLHRYCVEFSFRYNNKEKTGVEKFNNALLQTSNARITYNTLIGK